jgi:hypothetical protein
MGIDPIRPERGRTLGHHPGPSALEGFALHSQIPALLAALPTFDLRSAHLRRWTGCPHVRRGQFDQLEARQLGRQRIT